MDMTGYTVYLGTEEIDAIFLGTNEIDYKVAETSEGVKVKTLWINAISPTQGLDYYIANIRIYREDGSIIEAGDVQYVKQAYKQTSDGRWVFTVKNKAGIFNIPNATGGLNVYYSMSYEVGAVIDFMVEETITKIECDMKAYSSANYKTVTVEFRNYKNFNNDNTSDANAITELLGKVDNFDLGEYHTVVSSTLTGGDEESKNPQPPPSVTGNDDTNTVTGYDSTVMEWSYDDADWRTGTLPALDTYNGYLFIRFKETETYYPSPSVRLTFTYTPPAQVYPLLRNIVLAMEATVNPTSTTSPRIRNVRITKEDDTMVTINDCSFYQYIRKSATGTWSIITASGLGSSLLTTTATSTSCSATNVFASPVVQLLNNTRIKRISFEFHRNSGTGTFRGAIYSLPNYVSGTSGTYNYQTQGTLLYQDTTDVASTTYVTVDSGDLLGKG